MDCIRREGIDLKNSVYVVYFKSLIGNGDVVKSIHMSRYGAECRVDYLNSHYPHYEHWFIETEVIE